MLTNAQPKCGSESYQACWPDGGFACPADCAVLKQNDGGWKLDNMKLPVVLAGGPDGTLDTGRALNYLYALYAGNREPPQVKTPEQDRICSKRERLQRVSAMSDSAIEQDGNFSRDCIHHSGQRVK